MRPGRCRALQGPAAGPTQPAELDRIGEGAGSLLSTRLAAEQAEQCGAPQLQRLTSATSLVNHLSNEGGQAPAVSYERRPPPMQLGGRQADMALTFLCCC